MSFIHLVLAGGMLVFVLSFVAFLLSRKGSVKAVVGNIAATLKPMEAAVSNAGSTASTKLGAIIKDLDSQGLDQAAAEIQADIVSILAQGHKARLQATLAPKAPAAPTPPAA